MKVWLTSNLTDWTLEECEPPADGPVAAVACWMSEPDIHNPSVIRWLSEGVTGDYPMGRTRVRSQGAFGQRLLDYLAQKWPGVTAASLYAKILLWSCGRREEISSLTWTQGRVIGTEIHFQTVGKWGVKKWFRIPEGLEKELQAIRTESLYVFGAYNEQLRRYYENNSRFGTAKAVGSEFNPICLGDWFHERLSDWSESLPKGHAYTHVFRKTTLQYARSGEDTLQKVAKDARVSENVMMTHYVEENDPELREASNRTFHRILASLPSRVAERYGHVEAVEDSNTLQEQLQEARRKVAKLSAKLARIRRPTG